MNPFARQLLGWQAANPQKRAAALVLEVKGDFCHDIRRILVEAGRGKDYIELGMKGRWQWNPLSAWWLDSYSLAYTVSSLLNQLFGKGKEPFWQQAYTNLVRWIIELHRVFPERWVTLQQVYRCAIDPELFAAKIEEAEKLSDDLNKGTVFVAGSTYEAQLINLAEWIWTDAPETKEVQAVYTRPMKAKLDELKIAYRIVWEPGPGDEIRERVEVVKRWFVHDWQTLDNKVKSSIVEGVSVFLAMFDMPDVAKAAEADGQEDDKKPGIKDGGAESKRAITSIPSAKEETVKGAEHLPPLYELIEGGNAAASPLSPRSLFPRCDPCWEARKRGVRCCRRSAHESSCLSATTHPPRLPANCAGRWRRSRECTRSARPPSDRKSPRSQVAQVEAGAASALPNHSGSSARRCFTRGTSPCLGTARRFACPMTARSRLSRAGSTSSLTICPWDTPIGERRKQAEYERREWTGTPETVSTGIGERSGRFRSQRDHD